MLISLCLIYTVNPVSFIWMHCVCIYVLHMYVHTSVCMWESIHPRHPMWVWEWILNSNSTCKPLVTGSSPWDIGQKLSQSWFPILKSCSLLNRISSIWNPLFPFMNLKLLLMDLVYHLCTAPKMGFQRFKRKCRGKQNHTKLKVA